MPVVTDATTTTTTTTTPTPTTSTSRTTTLPPLRKPKRSLNVYNFFFQDKRRQLMAEYRARGVDTRARFPQLGKEIAEMWKTATAAELQIYRGMATQDNMRHAQEMKVWKARMQELQKTHQAAAETGNEPESSSPLPTTDSVGGKMVSCFPLPPLCMPEEEQVDKQQAAENFGMPDNDWEPLALDDDDDDQVLVCPIRLCVLAQRLGPQGVDAVVRALR